MLVNQQHSTLWSSGSSKRETQTLDSEYLLQAVANCHLAKNMLGTGHAVGFINIQIKPAKKGSSGWGTGRGTRRGRDGEKRVLDKGTSGDGESEL